MHQEGEWWYVKEGKRQGPVSPEALEALLLSGGVGPNTRVWRRGMEAWTKIASVADLQEVLKSCPPPIDDGDSEPQLAIPVADVKPVIQETTAASPVARLFARQIDFMILGGAAWFCVGYFFPGFDWSIFDNAAVSSMATIFAGLIVEVPVMAFIGTTPGKAIFGITVRKLDGSRLGFGEVAMRNAYLWAQGLGLGIPIVALFFMWKSYKVAKTGARNSWDDPDMVNVRQKPISNWRQVFGYASFVVLLVGFAGLEQIDKQRSRAEAVKQAPSATSVNQPVKPPPAKPASWINPHTKTQATLYAGWKYEPGKFDEPSAYWFQNVGSIVILGREIQRQTLEKYIDLLQSDGKFGQLEDKKFEVGSDGTAYYVMSYRKASDGQSYRVDVKVWQTAQSTYWRSVVLSPYGKERERAEARALAGDLERTTLSDTTPPPPPASTKPAPSQSGAKRTY